jgi:hypothetical protein
MEVAMFYAFGNGILTARLAIHFPLAAKETETHVVVV